MAGPAGSTGTRGATSDKDVAIFPWNEQAFSANDLIVRQGGPEGEEVINGGERANPCTLGSTNCYDRPVGTAPYPQFICGQFNTQQFTIADEFVPDTTGNVTSVCWLGEYSDAVQCPATNPVSTYGEFTVTYYLDNGFGFPGAVHAGPFTSPGSMTVTQGATGDPIGFNNPTAEEVGFSATHAAVAVSAGTCYWIEFDWNGAPGGTCFFIMNLSYENVEGNRRLLRMDANLGNQYMDLNKTNLDTTACIGFSAGALSSSNIIGCGEVRNPPANDALPGTSVACGTSVIGDNTFATYDATYPPAACRKSTQDPTEYNAGDVWYSFVATATTAQVSACSTATLTGQVHGDSLMQGFRQNVVGPDFTNANMILLGCSDDSCSGGLSEICLSGLTIGNTYYVRFWSFSDVSKGKFAINVDCPCPVATNDLCDDAILIPRTADGQGPGWGDPTGRLVLGSTALGTVDGNWTGCPGVPNTAKGIWYKLVGAGNRVLLNTDQVITGTSFDTRITVYCSTTNDCVGLSCLAANDDINATDANFFSEVEFCAVNGQTYFILVHGFGSDSGAFGMLTQEIRDGSNMLVPCCDIQQCDILCTFEIPQNATTEQTAVPGGSPAYLQADIACNDALVGLAASGPNLGCSAAAGPQRNFTPVTLGVAIKGDSHAAGGTRDTDWFLFRGAPNGKAFLLDYSVQTEGPMEFIPWQANLNYSACQVIAFGTWVNNTSFCGSGFTRRALFHTGLLNQISSYDGAGFPNTDFMFRCRNRTTTEGYNCATGLNDYWFRLNFVLALSDCPPIPTPAGTVGTDYDDERDQATAMTYDGSGGENGIQYEPCNYATPNDTFHRGKGGCNALTQGDGEFLRLTPGRPMIGVMDGLLGGSGAGRDVDWYKFDLLERSIVSFKVSCGGPLTFFITENSCENEAITYSTAATLGHCGARCLDAEDCVVLEAGTYIVVGIHNDAFAGGSIFAALDCTDPGQELGMAKYRIDINATAVPACSVTCPGGAVTETEACPNTFTIFDSCDPTNDGCAAGVFGAGSIASGTPVCGSLFSQYQVFPDDVFSIDTDYWQFTVASRQKLTYSVIADGPVLAQIGVTGPGGSLCDADLPNPFTNQGGGLRVLSSGDATPCTAGSPVTYSVYLEPGTYSLIVTPGTVDKGFTFADLACINSGQLSYTASITLDAIGSCAVGSDCLITTNNECTGLGGSFTADGGASCGNLFTATAFNSGCGAYSTIMGLGTQVALCGDNEFAQQVIPPFKFYGVTHTQVNISSNGYITFGGISSDTPRAFANIGNPNAVIAPFWNDWKVACAEGTAGATPTTVWIRTTGGLGNEVTTIEWKDLRKFELYSQSANFQVVLFHASGEIEFRYGAFVGLSKKDLDTVAVGVEDGCGLRGVDVALSGAFLSGNSCVRLVLTPPCCPGNSDKVSPGTVNFDDINAAIANWLTNYGAGTGPGDGNCDGVVNFDDINSTIANWLAGCP